MIKLPGILNIERPILLAPMEDVTDRAFRKICLEMGADLTVSEFISSEALVRVAEKSFRKMEKSFSKEVLAVQIFGNKPEIMAEAAQIVEANGAEIVDINFGCPVKKITSKGCGSALLQDLPLMKSITKAVVDAVSIPVTAKTRLGWTSDTLNYIDAALNLQDAGIKALTIHARTRSQLYSGEADWSKIAELKNNQLFQIPLIGNGDIDSPEKALNAFSEYGVDGVMVGRAAIGNPWLFKRIKSFLKGGSGIYEPTIIDRINVCKQHLITTAEWKNEHVAILEMRKFYSGYFKGIFGFKPYKIMLMEAITFDEVNAIFDKMANDFCTIQNGFSN